MIEEKNIIYKKSCLTIGDGEKALKYCVPSAYTSIFSYLKIDDDFICVLDPGEKASDEEWRRNLVRIDKNGKTVWVVSDSYMFWKEKIKKDSNVPKEVEEEVLKIKQRSCLGSVRKEDGKLVVQQSGDTDFFLNPDTGELKIWRTGLK